MYHSIVFKIDNVIKNTFDDFRIVPASRPLVNPPKPRFHLVEIPGRDGLLDLTPIHGNKVPMTNRTGEWEFIVLNPLFNSDLQYSEWYARYEELLNYLNGKTGTCYLEDDPKNEYAGRFTVNSWKSQKDYSRIVIGYDLNPSTTSMKTWNVQSNLKGCVSSRPIANIQNGSPYSCIITASSGYTLAGANVRVMQGAYDITAQVYDNGEIVIPSVTNDITITVTAVKVIAKYRVTRNLLYCSINNVDDIVNEKSSYSAMVTANNGYTLDGAVVSIRMGNVDVTDSVYYDGDIFIDSVTGDISITVTAVQQVTPVVKYHIYKELNNCTIDNQIDEIAKNSSYYATVTADQGYKIVEVFVFMGKDNITESAYSNGIISIDNVIDDIVLTITAYLKPVTKYTIVRNLNHCSTSNTDDFVNSGARFYTAITPDDGYTITGGTVTVLMDGVNVTNSVYANGAIDISSVTGNITINATAIKSSSSSRNLFDKNTMVVHGIYINENGEYIEDELGSYANIPIKQYTMYSIQKNNRFNNIDWNSVNNGKINVCRDGRNVVQSLTIPEELWDAYYPPKYNGIALYGADKNRRGITFETVGNVTNLHITLTSPNNPDTSVINTLMVEEGDTCHDYESF